MSKEKRPEPSGWKDRLEEPGSLTEWGMADANASWDKLYERLDGRPRRRRAVWYWAAAACLFLLVGAGLFRERRPVKGTAAGRSPVAASAESAHELQGSKIVILSPALAARRKPPAPITVQQFKPAGIAIREFIPAEEFSPAGQTDKKLSDSGTLTLTGVPVLRKELRVISINELDDPPGGGSSLVSTHSRGVSWFRLGHQSSYEAARNGAVSSDAEQSSGSGLLKINLSPQN